MILFLIKSIFENVICEYCIYVISTLSFIQFSSFHAPNSKIFIPIIATFICCAHTHPLISSFHVSHMYICFELSLQYQITYWGLIPGEKYLILPLSSVIDPLQLFTQEQDLGKFPIHIKKSSGVVILCRSRLAIELRFHVYSIPILSGRPYQAAGMVIFWPLQSFHSLL